MYENFTDLNATGINNDNSSLLADDGDVGILDEDDLDCPVYSEADTRLVEFFSFWVEGVLQTAFAILGILGNTVVSLIIAQRDMRNSFNFLLVSLACFDSTYVSIYRPSKDRETQKIEFIHGKSYLDLILAWQKVSTTFPPSPDSPFSVPDILVSVSWIHFLTLLYFKDRIRFAENVF